MRRSVRTVILACGRLLNRREKLGQSPKNKISQTSTRQLLSQSSPELVPLQLRFSRSGANRRFILMSCTDSSVRICMLLI